MPSRAEDANEPAEARQSDQSIDQDVGEQEVELSELEQLKLQLDEAVAARQRALADYQNFQRRSSENEARARRSGVSEMARGILPSIDNIELALGQETEASADQLRDGIKILRDDLLKALATVGITRIEPERGDEFDPNMHEAMLRQPDPEIQNNHVVMMMQAGYALGDLVLRPAKVTVASNQDG